MFKQLNFLMVSCVLLAINTVCSCLINYSSGISTTISHLQTDIFANTSIVKNELLNEWIVEVIGGEQIAREIAVAEGYTFERQVKWVKQLKVLKRFKRDDISFNDPLWPYQWQLHDSRTNQCSDMQIAEAWKMGYSGNGILVSILDDGVQHNHTDLIKNYNSEASYDLNDNDPDPMPRFNNENRHGTRCAGEVSMEANNGICGVGIAFNAQIAGIRMLDGPITDQTESEALNYGLDIVDIYSASWGPSDDGQSVEAPERLATEAFIRGIKKGRQGRGVIYVWASGNGGLNDDDCACDGYASSIYTFTVSSANEDGTSPPYTEMCAATLATTYSSGSRGGKMISTTDLGNKCTTEHSGTSAAAPIAAGIIALGLEANPTLTWRDVQHIAVWSADAMPLLNNSGWVRNAIGLYINNRFGFGLMSAASFVKLAKDWKNVPEQHICVNRYPSFRRVSINDYDGTILTFETDACEFRENEINYLEHVKLVLDISYPVRGRLSVYLTSPAGTKTTMLSMRQRDHSKHGFQNWPFMTVHNWGENGKGTWILEIVDMSGRNEGLEGSLNNVTLILYGTQEIPNQHLGPDYYSTVYLSNAKNSFQRSLTSPNNDLKLGFERQRQQDVLHLAEEQNREIFQDGGLDSTILRAQNDAAKLHQVFNRHFDIEPYFF